MNLSKKIQNQKNIKTSWQIILNIVSYICLIFKQNIWQKQNKKDFWKIIVYQKLQRRQKKIVWID